EIGRTEKRPVRDEAVGVEFAAVPAHQLLQIEIELRLKDSDANGAGPDPAANIGQKVVGIVERDGDAVALEIRAHPTPIAGQGRRRGGWGWFRAVAFRPGARAATSGRCSPASRAARRGGRRPYARSFALCPATGPTRRRSSRSRRRPEHHSGAEKHRTQPS